MQTPSPNNSGPVTSLGTSISIAVVIMAASNLLSKLLALMRMRVLADLGGVGADVDAYAFAFLLPELLNHFLAAGMLSITFIPIFQNHLVKGDRERAWYVFSNLLNIGTVAFALCIVLGSIFAQPIVMLLAGRNIHDPSNPSQLLLTVRLTRIILPAQLFFFWGALFMGVLYSHKRFLLPSLAGVLYNAGIIAGGLLLGARIGIEGFAWGVLAGALLGNVAIQLAGAARTGLRYRFVFNLRDPDLLHFVLLTIPLILGLNMSFSNEFLFRFFGSRVPDGAGAIASLEYSWRIMFMVVSIFGQSLAAGFYPFVSQLVVEAKFDEVHRLLRSILTKIGAILIPVSAIMIVLAPSVVTALLRVGRFDEQSVAMTAAPLSCYLLGMFFFAATPLVHRICYARRNTLLPLLVGTGTVIACIPLYIALSRSQGARGIALASSVCMIIQFFLVYAIYSTRYGNALMASTFRNLALLSAIGALGGALCYALQSSLERILPAALSPSAHALILGTLAGLPPLSLCLALAYYAKLLDIVGVVRALVKKTH